eukprot:Sspe_Gene.66523::Locus_39292_Transcript_1_1_Confidence_1.000_Length_1655::g.66523::m.66523/K18204/D2HGDH; D-2-hydroxyglutarate dehydrogenase
MALRRVLQHPATRRLVQRRSTGTVSNEDLSYFRSVLNDKYVLTEDTERYSVDWLRQYSSPCPAVLRPGSVDEVSAILKYCNQRKLAVVPQAGNTGLVGGSVGCQGREIILSVERMNRITNIDPLGRTVEAEAGVILQTLEDSLRPHNLTIPLDLAAKGSCCIGGNVATNAGGIRFMRYGSLHQNVLGLRAVLASGEVVDLRNSLPKDNTGFDLRQLFIGSEGTLGVITDVVLQVPVISRSSQVALLGFDSFSAVLKAVQRARAELGEIVSALEFADDACVEMALGHTKNPHPLGDDRAPFYLLIETMGAVEEHDMAKLESFLEGAMAEEATCGTVAQDLKQTRDLWAVRENITVSFRENAKYTLKFDISVPPAYFYKVVEDTRDHLDSISQGACKVVGFGHIGDGNVHLNVLTDHPNMMQHLDPWLYEWLKERGGSISAEHGIGVMKRSALGYSKSPEAIELMRRIKAMMDPSNILNPGKVLP